MPSIAPQAAGGRARAARMSAAARSEAARKAARARWGPPRAEQAERVSYATTDGEPLWAEEASMPEQPEAPEADAPSPEEVYAILQAQKARVIAALREVPAETRVHAHASIVALSEILADWLIATCAERPELLATSRRFLQEVVDRLPVLSQPPEAPQ